jgi:Integrase core domain
LGRNGSGAWNCQPGEELQLDFGLGAPIDLGQNKKCRSWVLRLVLSYSRKGYSEAVIRQDTETFIRCLENGLRSLGGSPLLLNLDNMKSAVLKADWFDPEINPKLADFCRQYGMHVVPCRPGMPHHKGKRPLTRQPRRQESPFADIHDNQRYIGGRYCEYAAHPTLLLP